MKFTERCASGEFRNRPTWSDQDRFEYLASRGSDPIYGSIKIELCESDKKEIEENIRLGLIKF